MNRAAVNIQVADLCVGHSLQLLWVNFQGVLLLDCMVRLRLALLEPAKLSSKGAVRTTLPCRRHQNEKLP